MKVVLLADVKGLGKKLTNKLTRLGLIEPKDGKCDLTNLLESIL